MGMVSWRVPDRDERRRRNSTDPIRRRNAPDFWLRTIAAIWIRCAFDRPGKSSMPILILGLVLFLGAHSVHMLAPGWRKRAIARIGFLPWKGLYSVVAIVGLALIVIGFGMARAQPHLLYVPPCG